MTSKFQKGEQVWYGTKKATIVNKDSSTLLIEFTTGESIWVYPEEVDRQSGSQEVGVARRNNMGTINKLTILAKSIVDADLKNMIKVGWLDSSLQLTQEGEEAILAHYLSANKTELGKLAEAELRDRRKDKREEE